MTPKGARHQDLLIDWPSVAMWLWLWRLRESFSRIGSCSGDGRQRWLRRNGKKGVILFKEDLVCDLKWHWDCYESVARIRLVKTENRSAWVTVDSSDSAVITCRCVQGVNKSNLSIQNPSTSHEHSQHVTISCKPGTAVVTKYQVLKK
jgi:hypothetical protein